MSSDLLERNDLRYAIFKNSFSLANNLLSTNLNLTDEYGNNAIILTILYNKKDLFLKILKNLNLDVDKKNDVGLNALMISCILGHEEYVNKLIEVNADVNLKDLKGNSPLLLAAMYSSKNIVSLFINLLKNKSSKINIDVNTSNFNNENIAMWLCKNNLIDLTYEFIDLGIDLRKKTKKGLNLLMIASKRGNLDLAKFLVGKNIDINERTIYEESALTFSCKYKHSELANYFIDMNSDLSLKPYGLGIFTISCSNSLYDVIEKLLAYNININETDPKKRTSLIRSVIINDIKMTKFLLDNYSDVNVKDNLGFSALFYACINENIEIVRLLLSYYADVNLKDNNNNSILNYIKNTEIINILESYGAKIVNTPIT